MTNEQRDFVKKQLRRVSHKWPAFALVKEFARVDQAIDPVTGRLCWRGMCGLCGKLHFEKNMETDHIIPVIPLTGWDTVDGFITRLLCSADQLQRVGKECHRRLKTIPENRQRRVR